MDALTAFVALGTALIAAVGGGTATYYGYRANQAAQNVDRKTATNHGMEPWQYLEMILEVRETVVLNAERAIEAAKKQEADNAELRGMFVEHSSTDEQNFSRLESLMTGAAQTAVDVKSDLDDFNESDAQP